MTTYVSILTTHQSRLRCFLYKYIKQSYDLQKKKEQVRIDKFKVDRFQNGCILKFVITSLNINIELIHNGEIDEKKPSHTYYVTPETTQPLSKKYQIKVFKPINIENNDYEVENDTYIFYLIRHGQASHNIIKGIKKKISSLIGKKDTKLTENGKLQAFRSGKSLGNVEKGDIFLFSSDLQRTRQTMIHFLKGLGSKQFLGKIIIILPCSHELMYNKTLNCDKNQILSPNENQMNCTNVNNCKTIEKYKINWDYYGIFYKGTRSKSKGKRKRCKNTNLIIEAIQIIKNENEIRETKSKKKTKTKSKKKTKTKSKKKTKKKSKTKLK